MTERRAQTTAEQQAPTMLESAVRGARPQGTFEARLERYQIGELLGQGGMGAVHRARDVETGDELALKIVDLSRACSEDEQAVVRERFERELRTAAALAHPNICRVFSYGRAPGKLFLTMELVQGATLQRMIEARGTLPVRIAVEVLRQLLEALAHAHAAGVVHRDLKPPNVMVTPDGRVKLLDFGIARSFGDATLTATGFLIGTPAFLAPEQVTGGAANARTDLFAAGISLLAMLTGRWRFGDQRAPIAMRRIASEPVLPLLEECPLAPPQLDGFLGVLCAQDSERRFAAAGDALRALDGLGLLWPEDEGRAQLARYQAQPEVVVEELSRAAAAAEVARADALLARGGSEVAAVLALHRASLLDPSPPLRKRLRSLCAAGAYTFDAIEDPEIVSARAAVDQHPNAPAVLKRMAELYRARGQVQRAAIFLTRALRCAPDDAVAASQLSALVDGVEADRSSAPGAKRSTTAAAPPSTPPSRAAARSATHAALPPRANIVIEEARTRTPLRIGPLALVVGAAAVITVVFAAFQMFIAGSADSIQQTAAQQEETVVRAEERATARAESKYLKAARDHFAAGQHSSAIRQVTLLLASDPPAEDALDGLWIRARSAAQTGDLGAAQADLRAFLKGARDDDARRADADKLLASLAAKGP